MIDKVAGATSGNDRLALLGLLADAVLPGEIRTLKEGALDPATLAALRKHKPKSVFVLAVRTSAELPSFVNGRVGTACEVLRIGKSDLELRGLSRMKITRAVAGPPPTAELEAVTHEAASSALMDGLMQLLAKSPKPHDDAEEDLLRTSTSLLRAIAPQQALRDAMSSPMSEALQAAMATMASRSDADEVRARLEAVKPKGEQKLSAEDKRELSALIAKLQRDLDLLPKLEGGDAMHGDIISIERRLDMAGLPTEAMDLARRQCGALRNMSKVHHDYTTYVAHLELMASLPWSGALSPTPSFEVLRAALETQHFGLTRPKKRIVEYLAVRALGGASRGLVLCLAGPPGVGKTSLARSIAEGLGRKLIRVPLGGVHDESEIRGHRTSFSNAGPGRILNGMRKAPRDAVMLLDEIDKIGTGTARSPAAALLEVLDPEQNHAFSDNFLGCGFDLSSVLFIATANDLETIPPALKDRLEVVELEGYTAAEKLVIGRDHVLPRVQKESGLPRQPEVADDILEAIIAGWTREAGVRELQRVLSTLYRDRAVRHLSADADALSAPITLEEVTRIVGPARFRKTSTQKTLAVGRVHGLSVGGDGGAVLPIEVLALPGKGELRLTGRQGEVMREAAEAARSFLRSRAARYGIDASVFQTHDLHVHLPEAAIKKDGPSAGVATFLAMLSALTGRAARGDVAVTGELTLLGEVLAVGGVRAKVLAAERAGLSQVVLPQENVADVPDDARIPRVHIERVEDAVDVVLEASTRASTGS